jgi:hypothetical protein
MEGHNPNVSMLPASSGAIVPMRGGGNRLRQKTKRGGGETEKGLAQTKKEGEERREQGEMVDKVEKEKGGREQVEKGKGDKGSLASVYPPINTALKSVAPGAGETVQIPNSKPNPRPNPRPARGVRFQDEPAEDPTVPVLTQIIQTLNGNKKPSNPDNRTFTGEEQATILTNITRLLGFDSENTKRLFTANLE